MFIIPLNKIGYFYKIIILSLAMIALFAFFLFSHFYALAQSPDVPITIPGSQFQVCTANVSQPACYTEDSPRPTLNWTFNATADYCPLPHTPICGGGPSSQVAYRVQIDDSGDHNGFYPSMEVDIGEVPLPDNFYTVPLGQLQFNTTYYWKVAVKDNFGTWSGWTCADVTFTTAPRCNNPPTATNLSVSKGDYCATPAHYFSWTYSDQDGDDESQFQFQIDNNSDFSSPEINRTQSGLSNPSPTINNQTVTVAESPGPDQIGYDTTYYWRAKVWDNNGADSSWINGPSFTTEKHQYPSINFNWSPQEPSQGENILFADQSTVYGGSTKSSWSWTFEDGNPATSNQQNPIIQFTFRGSKQVSLGVTDSDGYTCSASKTVGVRWKLPDWREILPW